MSHLIAEKQGKAYRFINGETYWYNSTFLVDIVSTLELANSTKIIGAVTATYVHLGPTTILNPLEEIRICRNFVAHKSDHLLGQVKGFANEPFVDLSWHIRKLRTGVQTFEEWTEAMTTLAASAAQ